VCRKVWFEEQQGKARAREEEEEARKKRSRDRFGSLLRHARGMGPDSTWESFASMYEKDKDFREVCVCEFV